MVGGIGKPSRTRAESLEGLLDALRGANRSLREVLQRSVEPHRLVPTEYRALGHILREEATTPSSLSRLLGVMPASTTELIDRLEERGLLRRGRHPSDRRSTVLSVTRVGIALHRQARRSYRDALRRIGRAMTGPDRDRLTLGLRAFRRAVARSQ